MPTKTSLVITSISPPNPVLMSYAEESRRNDVDFIVIGDVKSPPDFNLAGCDFWSIQRQRELGFQLAKTLPERHYARKNLGYLVAMERGAGIIIETDDDNFPKEAFWQKRSAFQAANLVEQAGWINVYRYFTDAPVWPRGFPLEYTMNQVVSLEFFPERESYCPIQQGLADGNPDVDAIYRLVMPLPVYFSARPRLILSKGSWSPFNSQNTTWFKEAFPLLYIPSYCSFRMCDIWRSFVASRICWANGWGLLFVGPTVWQERNEHNLLKDLEDELPGYLHNAHICTVLENLDIKSGPRYISENMMRCYRALVEIGMVGVKELNLLNDWFDDIRTQGLIDA